MEAVLKTEQQIFQAINPVVTSLGYEIVEVEITHKNGETTLTVYIDIPTGVSLDDCEKVHYAIDPVLDELDPSEGKPYVLNVSSPGLDRPFKKQRDYERNYGKEVEVKLYAPIKGGFTRSERYRYKCGGNRDKYRKHSYCSRSSAC